MSFSRREILGIGAGVVIASMTSNVGLAHGSMERAVLGSRKIYPNDHTYDDLARGANARWVGTPEIITVPNSTEQVLKAVQEAVGNYRLASRSGGHAYEDFSTRGIQSLINLRELREIKFDNKFNSFSIGAGALLGEVYGSLFRRWGVTLPGGTCPSVGVGGHVSGGGYGALSRQDGLIVDHLQAVEVIVIDENGRAQLITVSRHDTGAKRDLWWAHTGGGPGQFGLVTRYLFATPGATGNPEDLLPVAPKTVIRSSIRWSWNDLNRKDFQHLVTAFCEWFIMITGTDNTSLSLFSQLRLQPLAAGGFEMMTQINQSLPRAESVLDEFEAFITQKANKYTRTRRSLPWLKATTETVDFTIPDTTRRFKGKSAYLKKAFTEIQTESIYHHLNNNHFNNPTAVIMLTSYGGVINKIDPFETASFQRRSKIKINYVVFWDNPEDDDENVLFIRNIYSETYKDTGGVPIHNDSTEGCYIGYADSDLQSPEWNRSGFDYKQLYWHKNASRLAKIKKNWDPLNIFQHSQGV
ncbi:FAD-binding protein [Xenorhabdus thailandensis]|uniref:FAD-binding protein n=1 Tax=Xenorhabdus thailandensis TaxID=3136255 RepID=UPI0030F3D08B